MPHVGHCCIRHGCKYGSDECSVVFGPDVQEFPCEACTEEPHIMIKSYHHWMGAKGIPPELEQLVQDSEDKYFLPLDVLCDLIKVFDVQIGHVYEGGGKHRKMVGKRLMLDQAGGGHRQR